MFGDCCYLFWWNIAFYESVLKCDIVDFAFECWMFDSSMMFGFFRVSIFEMKMFVNKYVWIVFGIIFFHPM